MDPSPDALSLPALMEKAGSVSGLSEWGDLSFTETAGLLLTSCVRTADLNALGVRVLRSVMIRHLVNRLLVSDYVAAHGDLSQRGLRPAVVVTGLPRTGTTVLHNLLALDPNSRVLQFWQALHPVPPDPDHGPSELELVQQATTWLNRLYELIPSFRTIHAATPTGPEECDALLQNEFASQHFDDMFNAESYSDWLAHAALEREYESYALQLKVLTNEETSSHWVLKSPSHLGHLDALLGVSPDWTVVHCHRHPLEAVPSYASLMFALRSTYSDSASPVVVGRQALIRCQVAMGRALEARRAVPGRVVDVSYRRLVESPLATVCDLYEQLGRTIPNGLELAVSRWLAENPQGRHGNHRYDLGMFGLASEDISAAFEPYLEEFSAPLTG